MSLKELRKKRNMTQIQVANFLNIPLTTYSSYEINKSIPNIYTLIKLADFYNVSLDELVGRETETINMKFLNEKEAYLIKKILKMNDLELAKTSAYVQGLTE